MITPALVQADVVAIGNATSRIPPDMVSDANILYWIFYPNFASLRYAGGRMPFPYQIADYPRYWQRAARAGTQFYAATATLGEFAKFAEHSELEAIWLTDPTCPQPDPSNPVTQFDPRVCKFARFHYSNQLPIVRKEVEIMIASIRKAVGLLPLFPTADDLHNRSMGEWRHSWGDFPDAVMIASAKQQAKAHILSDDMDLATFPGIILYTANLKTINAASAAGRLL